MRKSWVFFLLLVFYNPTIADAPNLLGQFKAEGEGGAVSTIRFYQIGDQLKIGLKSDYAGRDGRVTKSGNVIIEMADWPDLRDLLISAVDLQQKFNLACIIKNRENVDKSAEDQMAATQQDNVGYILAKNQKKLVLRTAFVQNYVERLNIAISGPSSNEPEVHTNIETIGAAHDVRTLVEVENAYARWLASKG
jgi:hypothetical protein